MISRKTPVKLRKSGHQRRWKRLWAAWPLLLYLALIGGFLWSLGPQKVTRVSLDVTVSSVEWQAVGESGKNPDRYGFVWATNDSVALYFPPADIDNTGDSLDAANLLLLPVRPFSPVQVQGLVFPNRANVRFSVPDSTRLQVAVSAAHTGDTATLRWRVDVRQRAYYKLSDGRLDTIGSPSPDRPPHPLGGFAKSLAGGDEYLFEFIQPHPWKGPNRVLASSLIFNEPNVLKTEAISSILNGKVKLLEVDTSDATIVLAERDVLEVEFADTVEIFLRSVPAGIALHADGLASKLVCGPRIMEEQNNRMPSVISTYYRAIPHLVPVVCALLPLLLPGIRKRLQRGL